MCDSREPQDGAGANPAPPRPSARPIQRTRGYWLALRTLRTAPNAAWTRRWLWAHIQRETPAGVPLGTLLVTSGVVS